MSRLLRLTDCDTGETTLDVVKVPEGFSLQMGVVDEDYRSIIVSPAAAAALARALLPLNPNECPGHPVPGRQHVYSGDPERNGSGCIWCGRHPTNNDHEHDGA